MVKKSMTPPPYDPQKTIYLIDGSSFLYRGYYGLRPLHSPSGEAVQAVYSFCRMIKHLMNRFSPDFIGLVWDSKGATIRHEIYPAYKATRQAPPSDLFEQKKKILHFAELVGLKNVAKEGVEADDLLYSLAKDMGNGDTTVVLVTSDKDMAQVLSERVVIFDPFKDQILDPAMYALLMGFPVEKLSFYFALLGDTSDNIPGVKGIGKKGATELVQQFDSLADLYGNLDLVKSARTKQALQVNKDNAFLSEDLFKLRYIALDLSKNDFAFSADNWAKARPLFEELNFKSILKEFPQEPVAQQEIVGEQLSIASAPPKKLPQYQFHTIQTEADLAKLCAQLREAGSFAIDTETKGLDALTTEMVGLSVCCKKGEAYYIPCAHVAGEQLPCSTIVAALKPIFEDPAIKKYLHNTKFDQLVLHGAGIEVAGVAFDSMIAARLLLREWQKVGLKPLSEFLLQEQMASFEEVVGLVGAKTFAEVPLELATSYAAADAHQTWQITQVLIPMLAKEPVLEKLFYDIELPLVQVLYQMEAEGIVVDSDFLRRLGVTVGREIQEVVLAIRDLTGLAINLDSPKQVADLLFVKLSLPPQKKSAKGTSFSTDQEVLTALSQLHPVPGYILKYRELTKLKGTYIDALPTHVNAKTGRIHTSFNQISTSTGRLASLNPNLQNIPTDGSTYGSEVRAAFKPKPGHLFLSADYSQIELRVLAYLSQDANLLAAFAADRDIHAETASRLFDVSIDQVTTQQRQIGKRINFSILYGLTPYGLSKDMNIPLNEAKRYIETYFNQYPGVSRWMAEVIEAVMLSGYVETLWGRRRYIPTIFEKNRVLHEEAKRLAINTKAQGTAAEIMKIGMINIAKALAAQGLGAAILLQIHDEILVSCPQDSVASTESLVKRILEQVVDWNVPLQVTTRTGASWKEVSK